MKKRLSFLVVLLTLVGLSSCAVIDPILHRGVSDESLKQRADEAQEVIVEALANQDAELLKTVLSERALESSDLEAGIEYSFELFEGTVIDIEKKGSQISGYYESGQHSKKISQIYILTTDSGRVYDLYIELWGQQPFDPDRLGVDKMKIYDKEADDSDQVSIYELENSGIYNPSWDDAFLETSEEQS